MSDSDYADDDNVADEIAFPDRCAIIHAKAAALKALVLAYPLATKGKKDRAAVINDCADDLGDHIQQLQAPVASVALPPTPPPAPHRKRGRAAAIIEDDDEGDEDDEEEEVHGPLFPLSERAERLGIQLTDAQKKEAGLKVHIAFKDRFGRSPSKKSVIGGNGKRMGINQYSENECVRVVDPILELYRKQ